jgi:3-oxoacyl-[acyl-carrier-protein] synthase-1
VSLRGQGSVFAVGARSTIGLDATQTALMSRCGLPAITAAPLATREGSPVTMAFDPTQDPFLVGEERAARLAEAALREVAAALGPHARSTKLRVALAFPEPRPGQQRSEVGKVLAMQLRASLRETFGDPGVDLSTGGSAGLADVLPDALGALATRQVDAVLVGGAQSDYDPMEITALDVAGRLFTNERADAVIPGECAAFALVARDDFGARIGREPMCRIHAVTSESGEISAWDDTSAFDATALSKAIRDAASVLPEGLKVGWAIGDHGVEHYRTRELYAALTRTNEIWCPPIAIDAPAQRLGRLGAAALPLALVLAADMFERGYAPTPFGLLLAGSDGGERGAILVGPPAD